MSGYGATPLMLFLTLVQSGKPKSHLRSLFAARRFSQYFRGSEQASRRESLLASVSSLGIHLAHTFENLAIFMIFTVLPAFTSNDSASPLIEMRLFSLINASAFPMLAEL